MLNKIKVHMIIFMLAYSFTAEALIAENAVYFIDSCTSEPTFIKTPNGVQLKIELNNLIPLTQTILKLEYVPAGLPEDLIKKYKILNQFIYISNKNGKITLALYLPRDRGLNFVESKIPGFNIWNVNVSWQQTDANHKIFTGSGNSSIYRLQGTKPFFKVKSGTKCFWETNPSISSNYYYNEVENHMEIQRKMELYTSSGGTGGLTLGNIPNMGMGSSSTIPLGTSNAALPGFGWFFGEWSSQRSLLQSIEVSRDWNLARHSGGFFFDRFNFYRVEADRFEWIHPSHACGYYSKTSSGLLDIGSRITEFNNIPLSDSGSPSDVIQFLEQYRPTANTCTDNLNSASRRMDYLISSDENNMMFFYPR